jgi:hypothetical protein
MREPAYFSHLLWPVWLNETHQANNTNHMNRINLPR